MTKGNYSVSSLSPLFFIPVLLPPNSSRPSHRPPVISMTTKHSPHAKMPTAISPETISKPESPAPPTCRPSISSFHNWAVAHGIDASRLQIYSSSTCKGLGTRAKCSIKKGETLLTVPAAVTLQTNTLEHKCSRKGIVGDDVWRKCAWWGRLALLILDERFGDQTVNSKNRDPWVELLVNHTNGNDDEQLLNWNENELKELQYDVLIKKVRDQRKEYEKLWERIKDEEIGKRITYKDLIWAINCVASRAFSGEMETASFKERIGLFSFTLGLGWLSWLLHIMSWQQTLNGVCTVLFGLLIYDFIFPKVMSRIQGIKLQRMVLTPFLDFINHSSKVGSKASVDYEYFKDQFRVEAGENYQAGDEVFISYGKQGNDMFLQFYGFVEENNPWDEYVFGEEVARMLGLEEWTVLKATRKTGFDQGVMQAIKRKVNSSEKVEKWWTILGDICRGELNAKKTAIEEDMELLKGKCTERLRLAIQFRMEKKKTLKELIDLYS